MLKKDELPDCPVATMIQLINSKWKMLILRNLLQRPHRFNEIKNSLAGISHKVLGDSLRQLEADGIITRKDYGVYPKRVEYSLSEIGESMRPIFQAIEAWVGEYKRQIS